MTYRTPPPSRLSIHDISTSCNSYPTSPPPKFYPMTMAWLPIYTCLETTHWSIGPAYDTRVVSFSSHDAPSKSHYTSNRRN